MKNVKKRTLLALATVSGLIILGAMRVAPTSLDPSPEPEPEPDYATTVGEWADETTCLNCHEQAQEFFETGHANTLLPASHPASLKKLLEVNEHAAAIEEQTRIVVDDDQVVAVRGTQNLQQQVSLDWCFGSGTHAHTWVSTLSDSLGNTDALEFRWSWFASTCQPGVTPGQPQLPGASAVAAHGLLFNGPRAERCFACHSSYLPMKKGRIVEKHIRPGVTCQRCHGPRQQHVASDGMHHPPGWQRPDRMESVLRCAVCHRLPDEKEPEALVAGNPDIVRFQPMGLLQSACFLKSEMRCTTCHDPHKPMNRQDSAGIWQCVQCHSPKKEEHVLCAAGETERCLDCHMPKVQMEFPVKFTDHWIRVHSESSGM